MSLVVILCDSRYYDRDAVTYVPMSSMRYQSTTTALATMKAALAASSRSLPIINSALMNAARRHLVGAFLWCAAIDTGAHLHAVIHTCMHKNYIGKG